MAIVVFLLLYVIMISLQYGRRDTEDPSDGEESHGQLQGGQGKSLTCLWAQCQQ